MVESLPSTTAPAEAEPKVLRLVINGEEKTVDRGTTLGRWLEQAGRNPLAVAVERNGEIVPRDRFSATVLVDGDRLEVVQFVQGG